MREEPKATKQPQILAATAIELNHLLFHSVVPTSNLYLVVNCQ